MGDATAPPLTPTSVNPPPYSFSPPQTESAHVTAVGRHGREDATVTRTKHDGNITVTTTYTATYNESAIRRFIRRRRILSIISFIVSLIVVLGVLIPVVILPALRASSDSSRPWNDSRPHSPSDPHSPGNLPPSKPKWTYSKATGKCYRGTSEVSFKRGVSACQTLGGNAVSIHSADEASAVMDILKALDSATSFIGLSYSGTKWQCADGTPFDFNSWAEDQPFLYDGKPLSKCVTVTDYEDGWSTALCDTPWNMMCQKATTNSGGSPCE